MNCIRESFVFHAEYISDLPDEYVQQYTMYAVNYGICGIEPALTGLELSLWAKIKRRIDSDVKAWEETKEARSKAGRRGGRKKREEEATTEPTAEESSEVETVEEPKPRKSAAKKTEPAEPVTESGVPARLKPPKKCPACNSKKLLGITIGDGSYGLKCDSCGNVAEWKPKIPRWVWEKT